MAQAGDTQTKTLKLTLPAEPESVRTARRSAESYARAHGADADAVAVAVSEIVSNAVIHAFEEGARGHVSIDAWCSDGTVVVSVGDDGTGIRPNPNSPGLGFGLPLVASLSDELAIETGPTRGTRIRMRFAAAG